MNVKGNVWSRRPKKKLLDTIEKDLKDTGEWLANVEDRDKWKSRTRMVDQQ